MAGMVLKSKEKSVSSSTTITIEKNRLKKTVETLQKLSALVEDIEKAATPSETLGTAADVDHMRKLRAGMDGYKKLNSDAASLCQVFTGAISSSNMGKEESHGHSSLTLNDSIATLEEITLLPEDTKQTPSVATLMAHTELANRFNQTNYRGGPCRGRVNYRNKSRVKGRHGSEKKKGNRRGSRDGRRKDEQENGSGSDEAGNTDGEPQPPKQKQRTDDRRGKDYQNSSDGRAYF